MNYKIHNVGAAEKIGRYSDAIESALDCVGCILPAPRAYLTTVPSPKELKPKRDLLGNIFLRCSRKQR